MVGSRSKFIIFIILSFSIVGGAVETLPAKSKSSAQANAPTAANTGSSSTGLVDKVNDQGLDDSSDSESVKGVKKRGSIVTGENPSEDSSASLFQDEKGFLAGLDYPELQVVPRASERLAMEAQEERGSFISSYWPVQISAIALMVAGATSTGKYKQLNPTDEQKKENQFASQMGIFAGGLLLGATFYLDHSMSYSKASNELRKITGKDKKSLLLKERLAEESLERPAKVANLISNMSVWSTLALSLYINSQTDQELLRYSGVAIALSFLPWIFDNRIIENWEKHQEYKRKIYAPITKLDFAIDPNSNRLVPLLGLQWRF